MAQILRRVAVSGLGLTLAAFFAFAGTASAQGDVTVGGWVEMIGAATDHDKGADGFDRGYFSRINVGYSNTLDNGLQVGANINYLLNQRYNFAPDQLFASLGGGFGTISAGSHAMASCATLPRPLNFGPVDSTYYTKFSGIGIVNTVFAEANYCGTPTAVSYTTPSVSGFKAMVTYAPNTGANQATDIITGTQATEAKPKRGADSKPDLMAVAASFSSSMGGMNINLGASYQTSDADRNGMEIDSMAAAGTIGMGGATVGASWFDNGDNGASGFNLAAKYALGALTPGITWSQQEYDGGKNDGREETAIGVRLLYAVGGGMSVFADYVGLEVEYMMDGEKMSDDETLLMGGVSVGF